MNICEKVFAASQSMRYMSLLDDNNQYTAHHSSIIGNSIQPTERAAIIASSHFYNLR